MEPCKDTIFVGQRIQVFNPIGEELSYNGISSKSLDDVQFPLTYMQISHSNMESTLKLSPIFWTHVPLSPHIYSTFQPSWIAHCSPNVGLPLWWCRRHKRLSFDPWVGKIPWGRERLPTSVFWPGECHGRLYSPWSCRESDTTERLSLHFHFT